MNPKQEKKREKELKLLKFLNPPLEYIFQLIIKSRIKKITDDNVIINYKTEDKNSLIDLENYDNPEDTYNFEYNIDIVLCGEQGGCFDFIVENWKFKISLNPELNVLKYETEKKLLKKLHIFARSIQSLECLLPLNGLIKDINNKNVDFSFKAHLFKKSNIDMKLEKEIKTEKKTINLEIKEDKYFDIQLIVNYYTRNGIFKHKDNLKKNIDYNTYYTKYFQELREKTNAKIYTNEPENINENNENNNNELKSNFSQICDEISKNNELMFSNIVQNSMIEKNQPLNVEDIKQIKKEINNKKNVNLEKLFSSSLDNIEDINCRKNIDEILDASTLMTKENALLNNIKYNKNSGNQKQLIDEVYEEIDGVEIKDLLRYPPKLNKENKLENKIIDNYMENKNSIEKIEKNCEFKDLVDDYFDIKNILNYKN